MVVNWWDPPDRIVSWQHRHEDIYLPIVHHEVADFSGTHVIAHLIRPACAIVMQDWSKAMHY